MTEPNNLEWLSKLLDQLQAKDFYDAVQEVEKLGASDDFTKAVSAIGDYSTFKLKLGNHIMTREQAELAITAKINEIKREAYIKGYVAGGVEILNASCEICHAYPMTADCNNANCHAIEI